MSFGNTFETDLLKLILQAVPIDNIAANAVVSPLTVLYLGIHTASPGEAGNQSTNEVAYTGYARVAIARSSEGWTVTGGSASPARDVDFPEDTIGSGVATHFSIGTDPTGAGKLLIYGTITPNITYGAGVTPRLTTSTVLTLD